MAVNHWVVGSIPTSGANKAGVAKLVDAPDLGSGAFGVGVQVPPSAPYAGIAQLVEHRIPNPSVLGSNPSACANFGK